MNTIRTPKVSVFPSTPNNNMSTTLMTTGLIDVLICQIFLVARKILLKGVEILVGVFF